MSEVFRGFSFVELMVVLAIVGSITAVVFTNQSSFNKSLILANTAYDIALTIRSAETYGLGGRATGKSPTGYGIHLDRNSPQSFLVFADTSPASLGTSDCHFTSDTEVLDAQPGDCVYTENQDTVVTEYTLGNNATISDFCAYTNTWSCGFDSLDIVFARPNPDPFMSADGRYSATLPVTASCLTISSPSGGSRFIAISASGKISASATTCP